MASHQANVLARLKKKLAIIKGEQKEEKKVRKQPHCANCHVAKSDPAWQTKKQGKVLWATAASMNEVHVVIGRNVHHCEEKHRCVSWKNCRADDQDRKDKLHPEDSITARIRHMEEKQAALV